MNKSVLFLIAFFLPTIARAQTVTPNPVVPTPVSWVNPNPDPSETLPFSPFFLFHDPADLVKNNGQTQPSSVDLQLPDKLMVRDSVWSRDNSTGQPTGVSNYDSTKAENGVTLLDLTSRSILIDMNGKVLAKFPYGLTHVLQNGNMLGALSSFLVKYDTDLDLVWKDWASPHHEITAGDDGTIYILSNEVHEFMGMNVDFDILKIYSPDGALIYEWHVWDHLAEFVSIISKSAYLSNLRHPYDPAKGVKEYFAQDPVRFFWHFDPVGLDTIFEFTHFNSIQVLPRNELSKKIPAFKKGNLLLSFNPFSCYGILDTGTGKIEWTGYLPERTTLHTPLLTPTGTILVYQNGTESSLWIDKEKDGCLQYLKRKIPPQDPAPEPEPRNWVSITEYDPLTNKKIWEYTATPKESLQATGLGNAQRLSNGNTLVCTITAKGGKVFELTPEKEIVWQYISPEKDQENNNPLIFYRAKRISFDIAKKIIPGFKK